MTRVLLTVAVVTYGSLVSASSVADAVTTPRCSRVCAKRVQAREYARAHGGCYSRACVTRVLAKQCSQRHVVPCIRNAARRWHVSFPMLLRKARCESGLQPGARNPSGASGLFQILYPSTWNSTPYRNRWVYSAKYNSLAAAYMHHVGRGSEWVCV